MKKTTNDPFSKSVESVIKIRCQRSRLVETRKRQPIISSRNPCNPFQNPLTAIRWQWLLQEAAKRDEASQPVKLLVAKYHNFSEINN